VATQSGLIEMLENDHRPADPPERTEAWPVSLSSHLHYFHKMSQALQFEHEGWTERLTRMNSTS